MEFKHPKYYKELRRRNKLDQTISKPEPTGHARVRSGPGLKLQAATHDLAEATGLKRQASSTKHQATSKPEPSSGSEISSSKLQASSYKRQA
jgi:hypothetical protein